MLRAISGAKPMTLHSQTARLINSQRILSGDRFVRQFCEEKEFRTNYNGRCNTATLYATDRDILQRKLPLGVNLV